ncbi:MAG: hypothetical protein ACYTG7_26090 [Planctomycetota bacterium]|jgi:predicted transcriptional regulator
MKKHFILATVPLSMLFACGGSSEHEKKMEETLEIINDMADTLAGITDINSANAAQPKLDALGKKMEALNKAITAMEDPPQNVLDRIKQDYEPKMKEAMQRFLMECTRLMKMEGMGDEMQKLLDKMGKPR